VDRDSAIIGDAREIRETIHADHVGMAKFSSRDDSGYKKVLNAIEMMLEGSLEDDIPSAKERTYLLFMPNQNIAGLTTFLRYNQKGCQKIVHERRYVLFIHIVSALTASLISVYSGRDILRHSSNSSYSLCRTQHPSHSNRTFVSTISFLVVPIDRRPYWNGWRGEDAAHA
jgi:hypothetical protein